MSSGHEARDAQWGGRVIANIIVNAELCEALGHSGRALAAYHRLVRERCDEQWPGILVRVHSPSVADDLADRPSSVCDELGARLIDTAELWAIQSDALVDALHQHDTIPAPPVIDERWN